ncbi:MAG: LysR family transcriptional regulator [Myxococcota bacterium]
MPKIDHLVDFVAVVDAGSISAAARTLGIPRATLSRRLTALEQDLKVKLIRRETRQIGLTHAGEVLLARARALVATAEETWHAVQQIHEKPAGRLRLSLPPAVIFSDLLVQFGQAFPEIELQAIGTPVLVDMVAEGVDVALRSGIIRTDGLIARRLWSERYGLVASPAYLEARGRLKTVDKLARHNCIVGFGESWQPALSFPLHSGGQVPVHSHFACQDPFTQLVAALDGMGIALLPLDMTKAYVESGQLERILPHDIGFDKPTSLVFPDREFLPSPVRAFIDFTVQFFADGPYPGGHRVDPRFFPDIDVNG